MGKFRKEEDSLGAVDVPKEAYYGAQTARSLVNFTIGSETMPLSLIYALALVKKAAARANAILGRLPADLALLIEQAATDVVNGQLDKEFPLSVWQTGSGTQTNMNLNEVIANRGNELAGSPLGSKSPLHPNDHVNLGQSSNDIFPTAMHVVAALALNEQLLPALTHLADSLEVKAREFASIVKIGRTHMMDATPITLGQEFSGYADEIRTTIAFIESALPAIYRLAVGGTAVGTGINTHPDFDKTVCRLISEETRLPFTPAPNKFAALAAHDPLVFASGALKTAAQALIKIARDIILMGSGPRSGFGELSFPANEPGSSIMPGKVNPTQAEALIMAAVQVIGNDVAITVGGALGNFELNVLKPLIIYNFLQSVELLADGVKSFTDKMVIGLKANETKIAEHVERSLMLVTALTPTIGYDKASKIALKAHHEGTTLKEACLDLGYLSGEAYDRLIQPSKMTHPEK